MFAINKIVRFVDNILKRNFIFFKCLMITYITLVYSQPISSNAISILEIIFFNNNTFEEKKVPNEDNSVSEFHFKLLS